MKIHNGIEGFPAKGKKVVTSGTFDGVHLGHQSILNRMREIANKINGEIVLLTYWPHPKTILSPNNHGISLLTDFDEKAELLKQFGVNHLVKIPFTKEFSSLSPMEFAHKILVEGIGTNKMVIGYDHHFGKNREGNFEWLSNNQKQLGFEIEEIERKDIDSIAVSSSKIRTYLNEGHVDQVKELMGRPYNISGTVKHGNKLGRSINFPTANIKLSNDLKLIPQTGVYAVKGIVDSMTYEGMMNIGFRPTVEGDHKSIDQTIEVHLFGLDYEIYGSQIKIDLIKKIRKEKKFENLNALQKQLVIDKENVKNLFMALKKK